jgi:hypothetical protein
VWDITQKVSNWQIDTFAEHGGNRALSGESMETARKSGKTPQNYHDLRWHMGALYAGMNVWAFLAESRDT